MSEEYLIRHYKTSDFTQIANLWRATGLGNAERGDNQKVINETLKRGGIFLVLELTEIKEIIGTSWVTNDGRRLYLHHFGIKPEYQGKELAKILMDATLDFARHKKMQIKLEVHQDNFKALNLYKTYGFNYLGDYQVYIIRDFGKE